MVILEPLKVMDVVGFDLLDFKIKVKAKANFVNEYLFILHKNLNKVLFCQTI